MSEGMTLERFRQLSSQSPSVGDFFSQPMEQSTPSLAEVFKEPVQPNEESDAFDPALRESIVADIESLNNSKQDFDEKEAVEDFSRHHREEAGETAAITTTSGLLGGASKLLGASNPVSLAVTSIPTFHSMGQVSEEGREIFADKTWDNSNAALGDRIIKYHEEKKSGFNPVIPETGIRLPFGDAYNVVEENSAKTLVGAARAADMISPATLHDSMKARNHNPHGLPINLETGMPEGDRVSRAFGKAESIRKPTSHDHIRDLILGARK